MNIRIIIFLLALLSVFYSFADERITFRNIDTGESFDVSVPDGLKLSIQEYFSR